MNRTKFDQLSREMALTGARMAGLLEAAMDHDDVPNRIRMRAAELVKQYNEQERARLEAINEQ